MALRLQLIFGAKGIQISIQDTFNLTLVGYFFNNFLPTSVGGDIVKAMCAARVTKAPVKSATVVMMDRIFGLFMFILIPSISLFFLRSQINPKVPIIVYSFLGISTLSFVVLFNRDIARRLGGIETFLNRFNLGGLFRQVYDELHDFRNHKSVVVAALLISALGQCLSILVLYLFAISIGADPSTWLYFFLLVPVVHLISMLPSLNGLGIREMGYVYFLKNYIGSDRAAGLGILWLGLLLLLSLIGGVIYLVRQDYHVQFKKKGSVE